MHIAVAVDALLTQAHPALQLFVTAGAFELAVPSLKLKTSACMVKVAWHPPTNHAKAAALVVAMAFGAGLARLLGHLPVVSRRLRLFMAVQTA